eukprot:357344_1
MAHALDVSEGQTLINRRRHHNLDDVVVDHYGQNNGLNKWNFMQFKCRSLSIILLLIIMVIAFVIHLNRKFQVIEQNHSNDINQLTQQIETLKHEVSEYEKVKNEMERIKLENNELMKEMRENKKSSGDIKFDYSWQSLPPTTCKWTKNSDNLVILSGIVGCTIQVTNADGPIATLPEHVRPTQNVYTTTVDNNGKYIRIGVDTNGIIEIKGTFSNKQGQLLSRWISLEGIAFYTKLWKYSHLIFPTY